MTDELKEFLVEKLDNLINKIDDPYLNELCNRLVGQNGKHRQDFLIAPAAKSMHHGYPGGLLEHSLEVFDYCMSDIDLINRHSYASLNADLMISAALLHDIGKIQEYMIVDEFDGKPIYVFT